MKPRNIIGMIFLLCLAQALGADRWYDDETAAAIQKAVTDMKNIVEPALGRVREAMKRKENRLTRQCYKIAACSLRDLVIVSDQDLQYCATGGPTTEERETCIRRILNNVRTATGNIQQSSFKCIRVSLRTLLKMSDKEFEEELGFLLTGGKQ